MTSSALVPIGSPPTARFHQRRAVGPRDRRAVGNGLPRAGPTRGTVQLYQFALEGVALFVSSGVLRSRATGAVSGLFLLGTGRSDSSPILPRAGRLPGATRLGSPWDMLSCR